MGKSNLGNTDQADGSSYSQADGSLDACGLTCPLPLLKAKQALNRLESGQRLAVVCTDPGSVRDFTVFSTQSGHTLLEKSEQDGKFYYCFQKK